MSAPNLSRRGILGFLASAPAIAVAVAAPAKPTPAKLTIGAAEYDPIEHMARMNRTVTELERKLAARPHNGERGLNLRHAHCTLGCSPCHMECAVLPQRIAWHKSEIARAQAALAGGHN